MKPGFYPNQNQNPAQARAALTHVLTSARSLDALTPKVLVRRYNLPLREIEAMVTQAKARRAGL